MKNDMSDCIFCKIANKEIPSNMVYEDDVIAVFHDLEPQAPVHVLLIPKKHIESLDATEFEDMEALGWLLNKVKDVAKLLNLENGYRLVCNCGEDGFQTVPHLHFHLLGKRKMTWPPG
ncbi:histidine triad nucleotide-binding protein [Anaerovorax sp. IOR16]|uniref:histidine triad nucleotide-binding protein n=1 Tax=Anaerovorax sp. IOR16 TaxID=2773458 RepID=UPI002ED2348F